MSITVLSLYSFLRDGLSITRITSLKVLTVDLRWDRVLRSFFVKNLARKATIRLIQKIVSIGRSFSLSLRFSMHSSIGTPELAKLFLDKLFYLKSRKQDVYLMGRFIKHAYDVIA